MADLFRVCFRCKRLLPITDYHRSNKRWFQRECKECTRNRQHKWHRTESGKLSSTNTKLKARFGITLAQYEDLLVKQGGMCLICQATVSYLGHRLAVDHDHADGHIRGLLCKACNAGLGHFRDDPDLMLKAAQYLLKDKTQGTGNGH